MLDFNIFEIFDSEKSVNFLYYNKSARNFDSVFLKNLKIFNCPQDILRLTF